MTIHSGVQIQCPECGSWMRDIALASLNLLGWVDYSDGYGHGRLHYPSHGIRACNCGACFLRQDALALPTPQLTSELPAAIQPDPASLGDLAASLAEREQPTQLEFEIRVWRYWMCKAERRTSRRSSVNLDGLERLLHLARGKEQQSLLLLQGQLLRDLGRFDEAFGFYEQCDLPAIWLKDLRKLATRRDAGVMRLRQNWR